MTKSKFLFLTAVAAFLIALFTLEPYSTYEFDTQYIVTGIVGIVIFAALIFAAYFSYSKGMLILLPVSSLLSGIASIVFSCVLYSFDFNLIFVETILILLGVLVLLLIKPQNKKVSVFLITYIAIYSIIAYMLFRYMASLSMSASFGLAVNIALVEYFFNFFSKKVRTIASYILVGVTTLATLIGFIVLLSDGIWGFASPVFFTAIIFILLGILYFLVSLLPGGKIIIERYEMNDESTITTYAVMPKEFVRALEDLQKLREAGILTDEEFQQQKNKILGGNKNV